MLRHLPSAEQRANHNEALTIKLYVQVAFLIMYGHLPSAEQRANHDEALTIILCVQVAFLIMYGHLPSAEELANWDEALMRHSAIPKAVEDAVAALPHDAHFMGTVLTAINALSTCHPEQKPSTRGPKCVPIQGDAG